MNWTEQLLQRVDERPESELHYLRLPFYELNLEPVN
jgi:hypothetical protein